MCVSIDTGASNRLSTLSPLIHSCVCVCKCSHSRHLEISPSPFKWEVSCRALGTVRVGNPDKQTESHREWVSEWVCALPVSKNIYASQQCSACLSLLTVILPQTAAGSLHSEGPGGQVRAEKRLSQTTVLCMRWAIKAGEEEEEDGSLSPLLSLWWRAQGAPGLVSGSLMVTLRGNINHCR